MIKRPFRKTKWNDWVNGAIKTPRQRIQEEAWDRVGETVFSFGHELIVRHPIKRCASRGRWCVYTGVCVRDLVIM